MMILFFKNHKLSLLHLHEGLFSSVVNCRHISASTTQNGSWQQVHKQRQWQRCVCLNNVNDSRQHTPKQRQRQGRVCLNNALSFLSLFFAKMFFVIFKLKYFCGNGSLTAELTFFEVQKDQLCLKSHLTRSLARLKPRDDKGQIQTKTDETKTFPAVLVAGKHVTDG